MTYTAIALLLVSTFTLSLNAADAPTPPRDVSAELRPIVVQRGIPGLIAGIVDKDGLVALGAAGVRRLGSPSMISKQDKIHLGSCTKAMTATLIAILVEDGKLSWEKTVGQSFPELSTEMHDQWRNVTITQLLQHRSGAPADLRFDGLWDRLWASTDPPRQQRMQLVRTIVSRKPESAPGSKYIYSNAGYAIAGVMAEHAAACGYEELMQQRLFGPLGMTTAGFGAPGTPDRNDQPRGHTDKGKTIEPGPGADNPPAIAPAGTVHCSMEDWAEFLRLHLNAAMGEPRMLKAESFERLQSPAGHGKMPYAMGWACFERAWADGEVLTHNGTNTFWFCAVWMAPTKGFAAMAACNQGGKNAERAVDEAAWILVQQQLKKSSP